MSRVTLSEHRPEWAAQAAQVAAWLAPLSDRVDGWRFEHIGSTAVPGLVAKPVLDLLLGVPRLEAVEQCIDALAARGLRYRPEYEGELPERRYFVRDADPAAQPAALPRVHLHAVVHGGAFWQRHLAFRDALRADAALAAAYAALKQTLAARHADDKAAYQAGKHDFIVAAEARALAARRSPA